MQDEQVLAVKDFVQLGFLQELNRLFLHPAGLSLTAIKKDDGYIFGPILDYRNKPQQLLLTTTATEMIRKALSVVQASQNASTIRVETLGFSVQPLRKSSDSQ